MYFFRVSSISYVPKRKSWSSVIWFLRRFLKCRISRDISLSEKTKLILISSKTEETIRVDLFLKNINYTRIEIRIFLSNTSVLRRLFYMMIIREYNFLFLLLSLLYVKILFCVPFFSPCFLYSRWKSSIRQNSTGSDNRTRCIHTIAYYGFWMNTRIFPDRKCWPFKSIYREF